MKTTDTYVDAVERALLLAERIGHFLVRIQGAIEQETDDVKRGPLIDQRNGVDSLGYMLRAEVIGVLGHPPASVTLCDALATLVTWRLDQIECDLNERGIAKG